LGNSGWLFRECRSCRDFLRRIDLALREPTWRV
jgi:hypothetical protein